MAEAKRLWDLEQSSKSRITTIQAALLLSFATSSNGMDEVAVIYMKRACEMCAKLGLFGANCDEGDERMSKARIYTAWVTFCFQAFYNHFFFRPPIVGQPPQVALPDAKEKPQWYGEIWMQYPQNQRIYPMHLGHKIQAEAGIQAIMNSMGLLAFGESSPKSLNSEDIVMLKQSLDNWKDALPEPLQSARLVFPSHFSLQ